MREEEIRPKAILDRYLELSAKDGKNLDPTLFVEVDCPACGESEAPVHLRKNSFQYKKCTKCQSLFCSPRPNNDQLSELYFSSESSKFWSNVFFPTVADVRREKLIRPKAQKIASFLKEKNISVKNVCDVGAGHGIFLEELQKQLPSFSPHAIEPDDFSAGICEKKGFKTLRETAESSAAWYNQFDLILSFEVIEHVFDLKIFAESLNKLVKVGGHCMLTGLGYEGFDILTLQENSRAISPPHHLNFLSVSGLQELFTRAGFRHVEIWTPGEIDIDIVFNSGYENEFIRVLKNRGDKTVREFQNFLKNNKLSSHTWIYAQKTEGSIR